MKPNQGIYENSTGSDKSRIRNRPGDRKSKPKQPMLPPAAVAKKPLPLLNRPQLPLPIPNPRQTPVQPGRASSYHQILEDRNKKKKLSSKELNCIPKKEINYRTIASNNDTVDEPISSSARREESLYTNISSDEDEYDDITSFIYQNQQDLLSASTDETNDETYDDVISLHSKEEPNQKNPLLSELMGKLRTGNKIHSSRTQCIPNAYVFDISTSHTSPKPQAVNQNEYENKEQMQGILPQFEVLWNYPWFKGNATTEEAEDMLCQLGEEGAFLVVVHKTTFKFLLLVYHRGQIVQLTISKDTDENFILADFCNQKFNSIPELILFHRKHAIKLHRSLVLLTLT
ncbi:uncharacterized protein LOC130645641 isoform X2 [Hydractinia symbiolongicarpus]|nr:uncharacterized protein LOC130645641 isoform X2 [Hydractinia symbiolongicarpus]